uniref:Uncharacterized protein n=1 Tax=Ditylenchus dipsaci TaxID=166011 RepID=A0A915ETZ2_9BILA
MMTRNTPLTNKLIGSIAASVGLIAETYLLSDGKTLLNNFNILTERARILQILQSLQSNNYAYITREQYIAKALNVPALRKRLNAKSKGEQAKN